MSGPACSEPPQRASPYPPSSRAGLGYNRRPVVMVTGKGAGLSGCRRENTRVMVTGRELLGSGGLSHPCPGGGEAATSELLAAAS